MRGFCYLFCSLALVATACGGDGEASDGPSAPVTIDGVGEVPPTVPPDVRLELGAAVDPPTSTTTAESRPLEESTTIPPVGFGTIGEVADGNRVLVIGDSLMASTSVQFGGAMCERLVPLGWAVDVEAETSQRVGFGLTVLDERLADGWDAAVVMLGNNYDLDQEGFESQLTEIVERLAPRPTLLLTVTEFEPSRAEVNESIRRVAALNQNVRVADWANLTDYTDGLLSDDGLHLSDVGRTRLVETVTADLGSAPAGSVGECLPSSGDLD
jgi:lysophospholipase L1-like esterase